MFASPEPDEDYTPIEYTPQQQSLSDLIPLFIFAIILFALVFTVYTYGEAASAWIMPGLIFGMVLLGVIRKVPVYESFVGGAKEGFNLGILIIPYLVAILAAIGMFEVLEVWISSLDGSLPSLSPSVSPLKLCLSLCCGPSVVLVPLVSLLNSSFHGPDSYIGNLVSTMNGSLKRLSMFWLSTSICWRPSISTCFGVVWPLILRAFLPPSSLFNCFSVDRGVSSDSFKECAVICTCSDE